MLASVIICYCYCGFLCLLFLCTGTVAPGARWVHRTYSIQKYICLSKDKNIILKIVAAEVFFRNAVVFAILSVWLMPFTEL